MSPKGNPSTRPLPLLDLARDAALMLKKRTKLWPALAMILGSGFQAVAGAMEVVAEMAFSELPGFTPPGVEGHPGKLLIGYLAKTPVLVLNGRTHFYEGHTMEVVTFPVRALAAFGIRDLLITNAAGGINPRLHPGDFMAITDHINLMGANPLRGPAMPRCSRFVDLNDVYDVTLAQALHRAARKCRISLKTGVYLAVSGPSYETPAEIRAFAGLGADAVGMSTVPEAIVARQCGLRVAGLSCITNLAAGLTGNPISHREVLEMGALAGDKAARVLAGFAVQHARLGTGG